MVSSGCFPFFVRVLMSLIKLIIWLKFFHRQRHAEDMDSDHRVLLHFTAWGERLGESLSPACRKLSAFPSPLGACRVSHPNLSPSQPHDPVTTCLSTICEFLLARMLPAYLSILTTSPVMTRYSAKLTLHSFKHKVAHGLIISGKITVCVCGEGDYRTLGIYACTDFERVGI